jgi:hypothetical protein
LSYNEVKEGLDLILSHCPEPAYPRKIATKSEPRQWRVNSDEEALRKFAAAKNMDCRINLYSLLQEGQIWLTPDVLYIDLDIRSKKDFVLQNIEEMLPGAKHTILDSGEGFSIILPMDGVEFDRTFRRLVYLQPHKKILDFCAQELSWGKADKGHHELVRIPGTINSGNGKPVSVVEQWNGKRISYRPLNRSFLKYIMAPKEKATSSIIGDTYSWIAHY